MKKYGFVLIFIGVLTLTTLGVLKAVELKNEQVVAEVDKVDPRSESVDKKDEPPGIVAISVHAKEEANWYKIESSSLIFDVELEGYCDVIEVYTVPTGTEVYKDVRLVDMIFSKPFEKFGKQTIEVKNIHLDMGRVYFVFYNKDVGRRSESFNIYKEE